MDTDLLSVEEAAEALKISGIHLRKLLKEGEIPYINVSVGKIRKNFKIEKSAIEEFIRKGGVK